MAFLFNGGPRLSQSCKFEGMFYVQFLITRDQNNSTQIFGGKKKTLFFKSKNLRVKIGNNINK